MQLVFDDSGSTFAGVWIGKSRWGHVARIRKFRWGHGAKPWWGYAREIPIDEVQTANMLGTLRKAVQNFLASIFVI